MTKMLMPNVLMTSVHMPKVLTTSVYMPSVLMTSALMTKCPYNKCTSDKRIGQKN